MAQRGCPPGSYDDAEIYEVAAALGMSRSPDDEGAPGGAGEIDPGEFLAQ